MDRKTFFLGATIVCLLGVALIGIQLLLGDPTTKTRKGVTINIEKIAYQRGELVWFKIYTTGHTTVYLPSYPFPFIIERHTDEGWAYVYRRTGILPVFVKLHPGGNKTGVWNQRTDEGVQVPPGRYRVVIPFYPTINSPLNQVSLSFLIIEPSSQLPLATVSAESVC